MKHGYFCYKCGDWTNKDDLRGWLFLTHHEVVPRVVADINATGYPLTTICITRHYCPKCSQPFIDLIE
jgi:hypothetical protein